MFKKLKVFIIQLINKITYGNRASSSSYIQALRKAGINIGNGTIFYDPISNVIDVTSPSLLSIGKNVRITHGVTILTHDYSWSVIAGKYGECLGGVSPVKIGNNVFIGTNAIILKGVTIGDNVIIGAGSVITKDCESDSVYAGNPAKKIMSLHDFYIKRKNAQDEDVSSIIKSMMTSDDDSIKPYLREYSALFSTSEDSAFQKLMQDTGYYAKCKQFYANYMPRWNTVETYTIN